MNSFRRCNCYARTYVCILCYESIARRQASQNKQGYQRCIFIDKDVFIWLHVQIPNLRRICHCWLGFSLILFVFCRAIVYIVALYFFVYWVWLFKLKGSLHFLFCRCQLLSSLSHFSSCVFAFQDHKDLQCWIVLSFVPPPLVEVLWYLQRVGLIPFLLSPLICIWVASILDKCFTFFYFYYLLY